MRIIALLALLLASPAFADGLNPVVEGLATGTYNDPIATIHFYVDADAGTPSAFAGTTPIVNGAFKFQIPDKFKDGKPHRLFAYWVTTSSGLLAGSPQPFTLQTYPAVTYTIEWITKTAVNAFRIYAGNQNIGEVAGNVASFSEAVNLAPGVDRCYTVTAIIAGVETQKSNAACISLFDQPPPPPPPLKNFLDIKTDGNVKVTRCKTDTCNRTLQIRKNDTLILNGVKQ